MLPELLLPFALATLIFTATPGPGSLYCAAQSLAGGTRAGLKAALGLHLGGYVHVIAASLGLAFVFEAIPTLFVVLKFAGAAILVWMGVALIRERSADVDASRDASRVSDRSNAPFWNSILVEALNPTTALFFVAFLPQFVSPAATWPIPIQFLVLGTLTGLAFSVSDLFYAVTAGRLHRRLRASRRLRVWAARIGGGMLVGLGIKLALSRST